MTRLIGNIVCIGFAMASLLSSGCSVAQSLGISSPRYKLLPEVAAVHKSGSPALELPRELAKTPLAEYTVEPGDALLIQPVDYDSPVRLPADQPILPDGAIELGDYGRPVVMGKTVPQIEAEVRSLIKAKEKKDVALTVRLVGRQSKVFYVIGEVNSPGSYSLSGRETVLDGIMTAGGLSRQAQSKSIVLVRPTSPDSCRQVFPVCLPQIVQLGDTSTNYQLRPGDRIFVPSQTTMEGLFPTRKADQCGPCAAPQTVCTTGSCLPQTATR